MHCVKMHAATILVVDDDPLVRASIRELLQFRQHQVTEASSCDAAVAAFRARQPDVVLVDYRLPDGDGVQLVGRLRAHDPDVPCVVLTGHGSIDLAVQAVKEGAEQFLTKPIKSGMLETVIARLLEQQAVRKRSLVQEVREARADVDPFVGPSDAIKQLAEDAQRMVSAESPVLLLGETGSGKSVLARWFHRNGPRRHQPFVDLNCAGLSSQFLESELFGHDRGAFTGAVAAKAGLLEIANHGMLFLDEIGDMDLAVQPKLLKVLEDKRFRRLGEVREREVSVRLIAATHHDLRELVAAQRFRRDLYFRIGALPLVVPPLRERTEDIPVLAGEVVRRLGRELGRPELRLSRAAEAALVDYPWPGNVRELKNLLERAALLAAGDVIGVPELRLHASDRSMSSMASGSFSSAGGGACPSASAGASAGAGAAAGAAAEDLTLGELERRHILRVFDEEGRHVQRAAQRLGIPRSSLYQKLARMGIVCRGRSERASR